MSAIRSGAATSSSASNPARTVSASKIVSSSVTSVAGCSCATLVTRAPRGSPISPPSACSSPRISLNSVDFPTPFRPTSPTFARAGSVAVARSKNRRPQALNTRLSICNMANRSNRLGAVPYSVRASMTTTLTPAA